MQESEMKHHQLEGLKALWNYPEEMLNKVLWAQGNDETAIGFASEYIDYMEAVCDTDNPVDAWESWCIRNNMEREIENNPYI